MDGGNMKALTIRQPWAWAIFHAGKDIENRPYRYRQRTGNIAIHCALTKDSIDLLPSGVRRPTAHELSTAVIIGVVDIVDVVETSRSKWFIGPLGWLLKNPRALSKPIPCTGARRLWEVPPGIVRKIKRQIPGI